jgi:hypothetical protein
VVGFQSAADVEPIPFGHHHIEQDQVWKVPYGYG